MSVTIYHNPDCGTSRNTLAMIRQSGVEPIVIEYLKTPPSRERLKELISAMGISARALLRDGKDPIEHRNAKRVEAKVDASRSVTFKVYAEGFISGREAGWKNDKHRQQWRSLQRHHLRTRPSLLPGD